MSKLKGSIAFKVFGVILSYVLILAVLFSGFCTLLMGYYKFHFNDFSAVREEILTDMLQKEAVYMDRIIDDANYLTDYYSDKNIYFVVRDGETGKIFESNYSGEEYLAKIETKLSLYHLYNISELDEVYKKFGEKIRVNEEEEYISVEMTLPTEIYVAKNLEKSDIFSLVIKIAELGYKLRYSLIFIAIISIILLIADIVFLFCAQGYQKNGEIKLNFIDKIPLDIYAFIMGVLAYLSIIIVAETYNHYGRIIMAFLIGTLDYFLGLVFVLSMAARIKKNTFFKNTIIYFIARELIKDFKKVFKFLGHIYSNWNLVKKSLTIYAAFIILEIFLFFILDEYIIFRSYNVYFIVIFIDIVVLVLMLYLALCLEKIKQGIEKISDGDLEHKVDTSYMTGSFKSVSENLNNINGVLHSTIEEKMKSERFKTELITNVSHDIKTPLTSIINYVDLLKKEKIENEKANEYIGVLDNHSLRLKKLVEDLVEASKASSGAMKVNFEKCNIGVLLYQTVGEFEEKLNLKNITPLINVSKKDLFVLADGRLLWRVFENLMSNICKYSLENTRVYIDAKENKENVIISFRNISKHQLNTTADELMERFVRADASRNTEGSGLGLSIAKSLIALQNGEFSVEIDGDLFKAEIIFSKGNL